MTRLVFAATSLLFLLFLPSGKAQALELRIGQSWFEQGDYLLQPGVQLTVEDSAQRSVRFEFTGRKFAGFTQATGILSLNFPYKVLPWDFIYTQYGLSLMDEYTGYDSPHGKDDSIHAMNFGVNLGIGWQVYKVQNFDFHLEWTSHIFAAGEAVIYMTTARKTVLTAAVGYEI